MRSFAALLLLSCSTESAAGPSAEQQAAPIPVATAGQAVAVFAGGCFWCMESDFDSLDGVLHTTSGFAGGRTVNPTYMDVVSETTGHQEAVHVVYDTSKLSYDQVVDYFLHHVDPTDDGGQFCDRGDSYRPVIFAGSVAEAASAQAAIAAVEARHVLPGAVKVPVVSGAQFYAAELYHQDFHEKNPARYLPYRMGCGRDRKVKQVWGGEARGPTAG
jgi:peptide-methionine (S)-S-oxide reductase